ncbi:hypothetical protein B0O99DRAFT_604923 [Bisporella sp. PMI_857]|nr:hypothetical protein B0O99DRAFT_604923 [Bisporella sp. PMI_857]
MCWEAKCPTCAKSSWNGCGLHVARVMEPILEEERCTCEPKIELNGKSYPPKAAPKAPSQG